LSLQVRSELERVQAEKERYFQDVTDVTKQIELMEWERKNLRIELKELKFRESRLLADNNELEEENISLQKQISSLKSSQIDFETSKHEVRRLQEDMEALQAQLEEYEHLKKIAERQVKIRLLFGFTAINSMTFRWKRRWKRSNRKGNRNMPLKKNWIKELIRNRFSI
jgi:chromosome segregation ATPase